jgi:cytochrome c-type biogenesis protein CcmF
MRSFLSREATFLLNNLLFVGICFTVFCGTVFPILSEWATGEKISVSIPFFNTANMPLGLALLVLTGICPLIAWRKASWKNFQRNFVTPLGVGLMTGGVVLFLGVRDIVPLVFFCACGFVTMTVVYEFYKGARARQTIRPSRFVTALADLTLMNKRRYGGFIIHVGAVVVFAGIIGSSFFKSEELFTVAAGEEFTLGDYTLRFLDITSRNDLEKDVVSARLEILHSGVSQGQLTPEKHFHHKSEQPMTEVKIHSTLMEDLYVVLSGWDDQQRATFHVFINPLVMWIWIGIGIMCLGGVFVLIPNKKLGPAVALRRSEEEVRDEAA